MKENALAAADFTKLHNFKDKGVHEGNVYSSLKPKWQIQIYQLVGEIVQAVDPEFIGEHNDYYLSANAMSAKYGKWFWRYDVSACW